MNCVVCGAEDWETVDRAEGGVETFCLQCMYVQGDELPGDYEDEDDFEDICAIDGHDWQEVYLADGSSCSECQRCGTMDC